MATLTFPSTHPEHRAGTAIGDFLASTWLGWKQRRARHLTVERLASLDDRTLRDIGLDRSEIDSAVEGRQDRLRRYDDRWWDPFSR